MARALLSRSFRDRIFKAKRRFAGREIVGVLLWTATVIVVYGTLPLPFALHLVLVFAWLIASGLAFVMVARDNQHEAQTIFEDSLRQINVAHSDILLQMATYSEARDAFTGEHLESVRRIAHRLAVGLGESEETAEAIGTAAIAHDLGKIGIPDAVLGKPSELTTDEFNLIKTHTIIGQQVLGDSPLFELERRAARHHHEWWNGDGYPGGVSGEEIPLVARITAVADVFDALISKRPYKDPWPLDRAVDYLRERSGTQFDPSVVAVFLEQYLRGSIPLPPSVSATSDHAITGRKLIDAKPVSEDAVPAFLQKTAPLDVQQQNNVDSASDTEDAVPCQTF